MTHIFITYTKEFLQNYKRDSGTYIRSNQIAQEVVGVALQGKTRHFLPVYNINDGGKCFPHNALFDTQVPRLLDFLKQHFPDSIVEYKESPRLDGTIERGIIIDWS